MVTPAGEGGISPEEFVDELRVLKQDLLVDQPTGAPQTIETAAREVNRAYRAMVERFCALRLSGMTADQAWADEDYQRCVGEHMVAQDQLHLLLGDDGL